jgi:hypothetical protein
VDSALELKADAPRAAGVTPLSTADVLMICEVDITDFEVQARTLMNMLGPRDTLASQVEGTCRTSTGTYASLQARVVLGQLDARERVAFDTFEVMISLPERLVGKDEVSPM